MAIVENIDFVKLRKWAIGIAFTASIVWTIWTWSGGFSHFFDVLLGLGVVGGLLLAFDVLWVVGMAIQIVGAGQALQFGRTPVAWWRSYWRIRATRAETFERIVRAKLVWLGFYINAFAAIAFAIVAPFAVIFGLPRTLWLGLLTFLAVDTLMTFTRIIPQKRVMEAKAGKLVFHTARPEDLDGYLEAQRVSWGDGMEADRAKLESRFSIFPHGIFIAERHGLVVGAVTTIRLVEYDVTAPPSWYEVTADGWCTTHDPSGKIMFGVDMSATQSAPPGIHDDLLLQCMYQAIRENLKMGVLGGRMPGYHKFAQAMTPEEYLWTRRGDGTFLDPQVRMYDSFPRLKVEGLLPNYFDDASSLNNGVLLVWRNPFYYLPGKRFWARLMVAGVKASITLSRWRR